MSLREIPASEWRSFLEKLGREHRAWLVTVDRAGRVEVREFAAARSSAAIRLWNVPGWSLRLTRASFSEIRPSTTGTRVATEHLMRPIRLLASFVLFGSANAALAAADAAFWDQALSDRETVAIVQQTLAAEGYDPGPADGALGPKTVQAVRQAQKDRELEPTGRLDRRTVAALGISEAESASAGTSARRERR